MTEMDKISHLEELQALMALHRWYESMGVDDAVSDLPRDHFAEKLLPPPVEAVFEPPLRSAPAQMIAPMPEPRARPQAMSAASLNPDVALAQAKSLAQAAQSLDELRAALENYDGCSVKRAAIQLVFGSGITQPDVMVIGETPDGGDDKSGTPFSGLRGIFLNRMLGAIGMEKRAYSAHLVPWRPAGNAMPTPHDIEACLPFMHRHIALVQPKLLICLGWTAGKLDIGRGRAEAGTDLIYAHGGQHIRVIVLPELTELMRSGARKKKAWDVLRELKSVA